MCSTSVIASSAILSRPLNDAKNDALPFCGVSKFYGMRYDDDVLEGVYTDRAMADRAIDGLIQIKPTSKTNLMLRQLELTLGTKYVRFWVPNRSS